MYSNVKASTNEFDDDSATHDMNDDKGWLGKQRKEMMKERNEMHKEMKDEWKEMHQDFFEKLESTTKDAIEALHDEYRPLYEAIKNDTTKTDEEKRAEIEALHTELHNKVRALIPADLLAEFDALKGDMADLKDEWTMKKEAMKEEWKNTKADWKAKRMERRATMKGKVRVVFGKLDNVLSKFEANKTPEELVTKYTSIIEKLDEKIATIEEWTDLYDFLKSLSDDLKDKVAELQAA